MRSLAFKLTLAFLLVGLTGSALVAVIVRQRTQTAFRQFLLTREQQILVENLAAYYQANGSWEGVAGHFPAMLSEPRRNVSGHRDFTPQWMRFALVGVDRQVVFGTQPGQVGQVVPERELKQAIPLTVEEATVGWLILGRDPPPALVPGSPEGMFLRNVNIASLQSALVATLLALTMGGLLAFTLTRSLRELTEATLEIARGKLGRQVKVRSSDELGELATSFNRMSLDLARATQSRRQMTADIAHDLRSPLSVIAGYAEALSDGKLAGTPEVYAILNRETQHLSRLVEELRTLSLADAGELPLYRQPIQPGEILSRVASRHGMAAQRKGITLRVDAEEGLPAVQVDTERMAQVFDNLITNAFRYTPEGGEVTLASRASDGTVEFRVSDTGTGIAAEDLPHIFDRFYRGDPSRRQAGESGLGLAIAKSIVEAHGGTIGVESPPGRGATFTISLKIT